MKPLIDNDIFDVISKNVLQLSESNGYNQTEFASAIGMVRNNYLARLHGRTKWSIPDIEAIAHLFNIDITDIFYPNAAQLISATINIGPEEYSCKASIEEKKSHHTNNKSQLVAIQTESSWKVISLLKIKNNQEFYLINRLEVSSEPIPGIKVAVIDDDKDIADSLKQSLSQEGMSVTAYYNADSLIDELPFNFFQAFIVDYDLINITGLELLKIIRVSQSRNALVIILTGQGNEYAEKIISHVKKDPFLEYMEKPGMIDHIVAKINWSSKLEIKQK